MLERIRARLVDDVKRAWHWWSIQLHALMALWLALYEIAPALPKDVAALLPSPLQGPVIGVYAALGIVLRLIAQKKPAC